MRLPAGLSLDSLGRMRCIIETEHAAPNFECSRISRPLKPDEAFHNLLHVLHASLASPKELHMLVLLAVLQPHLLPSGLRHLDVVH